MNMVDKPGMPMAGVRRLAFNRMNARIYDGTYRLVAVERCFCGSPDLQRLSKFDRFGLPFGTMICQRCGLITLDRILREEDWASFYDEIYWPLIEGVAQPTFQTAQDDFRDFQTFIKPHMTEDIKVIMEVGCGAGVRLEMIRAMAKTARLVGCDYSDAALRIARTRGVEVTRGGMEALKQVGKADLLVLSHVFEHMPELRKALEYIAELTHEKSIIYVEVPGVVDLENKLEYGFDYQDYCVLAHIHNFSLTTLTNVFHTEGFGLMHGDEYVRAIFQRGVENPQAVSATPYNQIVTALKRANSRSSQHEGSFTRRAMRSLSAARDLFLQSSITPLPHDIEVVVEP